MQTFNDSRKTAKVNKLKHGGKYNYKRKKKDSGFQSQDIHFKDIEASNLYTCNKAFHS